MNVLILLQGKELLHYEGVEVQSLLITAIVALSSAVIYVYKSKDKALKDKDLLIKEKDALIMKVIKDHQDDLKVGLQDVKLLAENYFKFTETIKEIANGNK